ncbi:unnamed protein product, partial [Prorocentrum cordatum]
MISLRSNGFHPRHFSNPTSKALEVMPKLPPAQVAVDGQLLSQVFTAFNRALGRSTTEGIWRHAARAAVAEDCGEELGALVADAQQCCERVAHAGSWRECCLAQFPLHLLATGE